MMARRLMISIMPFVCVSMTERDYTITLSLNNSFDFQLEFLVSNISFETNAKDWETDNSGSLSAWSLRMGGKFPVWKLLGTRRHVVIL
jgi:hypothetical protein